MAQLPLNDKVDTKEWTCSFRSFALYGGRLGYMTEVTLYTNSTDETRRFTFTGITPEGAIERHHRILGSTAHFVNLVSQTNSIENNPALKNFFTVAK